MHGGLGRGKFYIGEVSRIESWHSENLPPSGYTPEQIEAGFERLANKFDFYHTLLYMEKVTPYKRTELLEWSVMDFKFNLRYLAWQGWTNEQYQKIMEKKRK